MGSMLLSQHPQASFPSQPGQQDTQDEELYNTRLVDHEGQFSAPRTHQNLNTTSSISYRPENTHDFTKNVIMEENESEHMSYNANQGFPLSVLLDKSDQGDGAA